jgi:hypothetical protein
VLSKEQQALAAQAKLDALATAERIEVHTPLLLYCTSWKLAVKLVRRADSSSTTHCYSFEHVLYILVRCTVIYSDGINALCSALYHNIHLLNGFSCVCVCAVCVHKKAGHASSVAEAQTW